MGRRAVVGLQVREPEPRNVVEFWDVVGKDWTSNGLMFTRMHKFASSMLDFVGNYFWYQREGELSSFLKRRSGRSVAKGSGTELEISARLVFPTDMDQIMKFYRYPTNGDTPAPFWPWVRSAKTMIALLNRECRQEDEPIILAKTGANYIMASRSFYITDHPGIREFALRPA